MIFSRNKKEFVKIDKKKLEDIIDMIDKLNKMVENCDVKILNLSNIAAENRNYIIQLWNKQHKVTSPLEETIFSKLDIKNKLPN